MHDFTPQHFIAQNSDGAEETSTRLCAVSKPCHLSVAGAVSHSPPLSLRETLNRLSYLGLSQLESRDHLFLFRGSGESEFEDEERDAGSAAERECRVHREKECH